MLQLFRLFNLHKIFFLLFPGYVDLGIYNSFSFISSWLCPFQFQSVYPSGRLIILKGNFWTISNLSKSLYLRSEEPYSKSNQISHFTGKENAVTIYHYWQNWHWNSRSFACHTGNLFFLPSSLIFVPTEILMQLMVSLGEEIQMWPWRHVDKHVTSRKSAKVIGFPKKKQRNRLF